MSTVSLTYQDNIAFLRLALGATNPLGNELLGDLEAALDEVEAGARGLVLAGNDKFFSIGLNLPELVACDRAAMAAFCARFERLGARLYALPIPTASALAGHAVAGGCVLALAADLRLIAAGKKLIGLNEVTIGLPVPYLADLALRQLVGERQASELLYAGRFLSGSEAAALGLVDAVVPQEEVEAQALERVAALAAHPPAAFAAIKQTRTEAVLERYGRLQREKLEQLLDCWFERSTQELLREAAKKF